MKKILIVVGTRPNFIKVTQFKKIVSTYKNLEVKIVHTGQHYDEMMSGVFFKQFDLVPDFFLNSSKDTVLGQMASIMISLEKLILNKYLPDLIIVPGDVNSTLAASLVANKLSIKLAHLESGLRSFDNCMPEEYNRKLTDELADYLFVTESSGLVNLQNEKKEGQVYLVGNTMIDSIFHFQKEIESSSILKDLKVNMDFVLLTMHRPSNVDTEKGIMKIVKLLQKLSQKHLVVFPVHPRTRKKIIDYNLLELINNENIILTNAMGYFEFQNLIKNCKFVLTDSGGIQEESTYYQKPCLTLRDNTERPITVEEGSNTLIPFELDVIYNQITVIEEGNYKKGVVHKKWDGSATKRIVKIISNEILSNEG